MLPLLSERKRFLDSFHEYVISGACVGGDFDKFGANVCLQGEFSLTVQLKNLRDRLYIQFSSNLQIANRLDKFLVSSESASNNFRTCSLIMISLRGPSTPLGSPNGGSGCRSSRILYWRIIIAISSKQLTLQGLTTI